MRVMRHRTVSGLYVDVRDVDGLERAPSIQAKVNVHAFQPAPHHRKGPNEPEPHGEASPAFGTRHDDDRVDGIYAPTRRSVAPLTFPEIPAQVTDAIRIARRWLCSVRGNGMCDVWYGIEHHSPPRPARSSKPRSAGLLFSVRRRVGRTRGLRRRGLYEVDSSQGDSSASHSCAFNLSLMVAARFWT